MGFDISIKVNAKLAKPKKGDINIEFYANGPTLEKIVKGTEIFIKDYIKAFEIKDVNKVVVNYGDKEGLITSTLEDLISKI